MKIVTVEAIHKTFELSHPSSVAYGTDEVAENVIVRLETNSGLVGWGCCAPDTYVTGDDARSDIEYIDNQAREVLLGGDPTTIEALHTMLRPSGIKYPAALAGLDIALYDLLGKITKLPVYRLLGGFRHSIPTTITVGLWPLDQAIEIAKEYQGMGYRHFKLKLGQGVEADLERVWKIAEVLGRSYPLRLDANQAYDAHHALELIKGLAGLNVDFLEQPTPEKDLDALAKVTSSSDLPIMADEPVKDSQTALEIVKLKAADLLNIKLMKSGGITPSRPIDAVAQAAGLGTMVGCMDESMISITAGLHFALSSSNLVYADLDGNVDLIDDVATGGFELVEGNLVPSQEPGLGCMIRL